MIVDFDGIHPKIDPTAFIAENAMVIGDVEIGPAANIWFHSIVRGDTNYIGIGAIVLNGAEIGKESIVGAGSVVSPKTVIPPRSLAIGIPAKVVRAVTEEDVRMIQGTAAEYLWLMEFYAKQK